MCSSDLVIPFGLEMYALRRLTTAAFGTLMCLEPALALLAGLALLGQVPQLWALAGVALVVTAGLGAERTGARQVPEQAGPGPRVQFDPNGVDVAATQSGGSRDWLEQPQLAVRGPARAP